MWGCPRVDSNHHALRHRPSTCCVYHSATRANCHGLRSAFYTEQRYLSIPASPGRLDKSPPLGIRHLPFASAALVGTVLLVQVVVRSTDPLPHCRLGLPGII